MPCSACYYTPVYTQTSHISHPANTHMTYKTVISKPPLIELGAMTLQREEDFNYTLRYELNVHEARSSLWDWLTGGKTLEYSSKNLKVD